MANETLKDIACYTINFGEALADLSTSATFEGDKVKINYNNVLQLIQILHDNIAETLQECEGKTFVITVPNGLIGSAIQTIVKDVFKLNINFEVEDGGSN